jgi:hypothetical protein
MTKWYVESCICHMPVDTEGLVPPKLLQLDGLLSTCHQRCQLRLTCTVGVQQCMHASDLLACGGGLGLGSHSVLHACTVSFDMPVREQRPGRLMELHQHGVTHSLDLPLDTLTESFGHQKF